MTATLSAEAVVRRQDLVRPRRAAVRLTLNRCPYSQGVKRFSGPRRSNGTKMMQGTPGAPFCAPLVLAASAAEDDVVRYLLAHGADENRKSLSGNTALSDAVSAGNYHTVKLLLKHGAHVHSVFGPGGRLPARLAESKSPRYVVIRELLIATCRQTGILMGSAIPFQNARWSSGWIGRRDHSPSRSGIVAEPCGVFGNIEPSSSNQCRRKSAQLAPPVPLGGLILFQRIPVVGPRLHHRPPLRREDCAVVECPHAGPRTL